MGASGDSVFDEFGRQGVVGDMPVQLDEIVASRDRMAHLLRVIVGLASDLDLDATLLRIVTAAMELTGARYGALGVRAADGRLLSFVHAGVDSATAARIGHLPVGRGVLGVLLDHPEPLRLDDLGDHPAAVGFPKHHPPMGAFLGVPITIRELTFGSLYLTEPTAHPAFTEADEAAARALASAAAVAVDNARLFDRVRVTGEWMAASRSITTALVSETGPVARPLRMIAERVCTLTGSAEAIVLVPDEADLAAEEVDTLVVSAAFGSRTDEALGQRVPVAGSTTGGVFRSGTPLITPSLGHPVAAFTDGGQRPALVTPLRAGPHHTLGVLVVVRNEHDAPFDESLLDLVSDFADHAAVALVLAESREQARQLSVISDRERIAHDLHDHVIQRLFAAGMDLQGTIARSRSPEITRRLTRTVDELQGTIDEIRSRIFALQSPSTEADVRRRLQDAVAVLTESSDIETTLRISGPLGVLGADVVEHAISVVNEAVSNAVRHSGGQHLEVEVDVADDLSVVVTDDGCGLDPDNHRRSGMSNMLRRAELLGGGCHVEVVPAGGTRVRWSAPLDGT